MIQKIISVTALFFTNLILHYIRFFTASSFLIVSTVGRWKKLYLFLVCL